MTAGNRYLSDARLAKLAASAEAKRVEAARVWAQGGRCEVDKCPLCHPGSPCPWCHPQGVVR
jgi:hypothetical protein